MLLAAKSVIECLGALEWDIQAKAAGVRKSGDRGAKSMNQHRGNEKMERRIVNLAIVRRLEKSMNCDLHSVIGVNCLEA